MLIAQHVREAIHDARSPATHQSAGPSVSRQSSGASSSAYRIGSGVASTAECERMLITSCSADGLATVADEVCTCGAAQHGRTTRIKKPSWEAANGRIPFHHHPHPLTRPPSCSRITTRRVRPHTILPHCPTPPRPIARRPGLTTLRAVHSPDPLPLDTLDRDAPARASYLYQETSLLSKVLLPASLMFCIDAYAITFTQLRDTLFSPFSATLTGSLPPPHVHVSFCTPLGRPSRQRAGPVLGRSARVALPWPCRCPVRRRL